jgi:hypothetical protein
MPDANLRCADDNLDSKKTYVEKCHRADIPEKFIVHVILHPLFAIPYVHLGLHLKPIFLPHKPTLHTNPATIYAKKV